jgi:small subunit ribosomal protein S3Ae
MPTMVSRARRAKEKRKAKRWYRVLTSKELGEIELDSALATSPESMIGRVVRISGQAISGDFSKGHLRLLFKIEKVNGDDGIAMFIGHEAGSDYMRGLVRRRRSRIDSISEGTTKDGYRVRVHPVVVTRSRMNQSQGMGISGETTSYLEEYLPTISLGQFFQDLLSGSIAREIHSRCKKIIPISGVELVRSHVERVEGLEVEEREESVPEVEERGELVPETGKLPSEA